MNPEILKAWSTALRSGKYKQTIGVLGRAHDFADGHTTYSAGFCCLGVVCELAVEAGVVHRTTDVDDYGCEVYCYSSTRGTFSGFWSAFLPVAVAEWMGCYPDRTVNFDLTDYDDPHLSAYFRASREEALLNGFKFIVSAEDLNDTFGFTFDQIADCIDQGRIVYGKDS